MNNIDWLGAFLIGLAGAGHCMGMCGGIASAVALNGRKNSFQITLLYNFGRISSYLLIGALVGGAVASSLTVFDSSHFLTVLRAIAAVMILLLGLYLAQWWNGLLKIEKMGQHLWKYLSPIAAKMIPLRSPWYAFPVGMVWGWIPCGMVYSMLSWAAVAGSATNGLLIMGCFGLGTLPAMILVGAGSAKYSQFFRSQIIRRVIGSLMIVYSIYSIFLLVK
ncbi:cytochrome biogenesis protein [Vibrio inusitatus NBRC 102082]|uniref:Cytochrome biogenesis protein n=1 Tax=Vibrio inusitatus NBRC 102082 TaxID=1219070 RepID=A0A4Y3HV80_9VIBR|nr:sulfite exporter TauE/SafE family protein [Vibrio inusitatus]GEA50881.1 cytochrome biogenesis protein [Vibrio inusitatus NBRC 102082]